MNFAAITYTYKRMYIEKYMNPTRQKPGTFMLETLLDDIQLHSQKIYKESYLPLIYCRLYF